MIPTSKLERLLERFHAVEAELSSGLSGPAFVKLSKEHSDLAPVVEAAQAYRNAEKQLEETEALFADPETDNEMRDMAEQERADIKASLEKLERELKLQLLPKDAADNSSAIVEIRAGTGGDEASLFAADLLRMYSRFAEGRGWKIESLDTSPSEVGGFKEVIVKISGEDVYRVMKYESGVHRVQRVPATEAQGRIHTSAATVAVMPEAEEVDFELKSDEVRIEVCRSSGAGGQGVNTTDSAVQVLHIPTGTIVRCQDGRSQIKNKEKALSILRSRLLERKQQEEAAKYSANRKNLIGSGGREEKIRTYNYPQNRVTDHRIELTLYNLDQFMEGRIEGILQALLASDLKERLAEAGLS